jgi:hypothetical protein
MYREEELDEETPLDTEIDNPPVPEMAPPVQDAKPNVRQYLMDKYGLGPNGAYSADKRAGLEQTAKEDLSGPNWAAGFASFGGDLVNGGGTAAAKDILDRQTAKAYQPVKDFDERQANQYKLATTERQEKVDARADEKWQKEKELEARELDPNSAESQAAQSVAISMGLNPEIAKGQSAQKLKALSPVLEKRYALEQQTLQKQQELKAKKEENQANRENNRIIAGINSAVRREDKADARQDKVLAEKEKTEEKRSHLQTPVGEALTADDAKVLKTAYETKQNIDFKLNRLQALREKNSGGVLNPFNDDVVEAQSLATSLLLDYKNLAQLGVLSASDTEMLDRLIPKDPLAKTKTDAQINTQLASLKDTSNNRFDTSVKARTREGGQNVASKPQPSADTGYTIMKAPDGKVKKIPNNKVKDALAAGATKV